MSATAQLARSGVRPNLNIALAAVGFSSVIAQIVLMRELFVISYGNELSLGLTLALWLIWTAFGSSVLGRMFERFSAVRLLAYLQIAAAIGLFVSILLVRSSRGWWSAMPGEVLGPVPILGTALISLAAFCPVSGWLFAAGARAYAENSGDSISGGGSSAYLLEALGSAVGGLLASAILVRHLDSWQTLAIVAAVNLAMAVLLLFHRAAVRSLLILLALSAASAGLFSSRRLEMRLAAKAWLGFRVLATSNSRYGSLAVIENEGNRSVVQNGMVLFTVPDKASAEEAAHFPLLEHASPRVVLVIGGGLNGSIAEVLRHPGIERVDYVELDPEVLRLARDSFPEEWNKALSDGRVKIHHVDGRLFLKTINQHYDVIVLNVPDPQTAQLNRFYTREFFEEVKARLSPNGVVGFQLHAAEEYISPELAEFLGCIRATLKQVFADVIIVPGENVHFLASPRAGTLTNDPQLLVRRLTERAIETAYIREYYLPFRMTPERTADLETQLASVPAARINRDFSPIAYYFNIALWGSQFSLNYRDAFLRAAAIPFRWIFVTVGALVLGTTALAGSGRRSALPERSSGLAVVISGLTSMAGEIFVLLGFQAIYGYVFDELAVIVAGFMAGMALGSWYARRSMSQIPERNTTYVLRRLFVVQLAVALVPVLIVTVLSTVAGLGLSLRLFAYAGFPLVAAFCGMLGGYQFPIALRVFCAPGASERNAAGKLYGLDLLGASLGALAICAYILPVFGFLNGALLIAFANVGPLILIALALRQSTSVYAP